MPYSEDPIPAGEDAARLAEKPFFLGANILATDWNTPPQWRTSGRWDSGDDISDYETNCPWFASDNCGDAFSSPLSSVIGQAEVSLLFWVNSVEFDTVLLLNHNFDELGADLVVDWDISNDQDFSPVNNLISWTGFTSKARRLGYVTLGATRVTDGVYLRLRLRYSLGSTFPVVPRIGELYLGRRRQLSYMSDEPFDHHHYRSTVDVHDAPAGYQTRKALSAGGKLIDIVNFSDGPDIFGHDQGPELVAWFEECEWGTAPSVVVLNGASSSSAEVYVVYSATEFEQPNVEAEIKHFAMRFEEIAPFRARGF